jgi:dephospho-CoA kinase
MSDKKVITLVGMPGAGKSSCVDYLTGKGLPSVYFGGITLAEIKKRGLDINPENEKFVREDIRKQEGKDAYARRIVAQIKELFEAGSQQVVADGLYSWSEYKVFKDEFDGDAVIIAVAAARQLRHDRLVNRPVRPLTDAEVTAREYAEIENIEKGGPIANADYTLINNGTPEELLAGLDDVLDQAGIHLGSA